MDYYDHYYAVGDQFGLQSANLMCWLIFVCVGMSVYFAVELISLDNKNTKKVPFEIVEEKNWPYTYTFPKHKAQQIPVDLGERMKYYEKLCLGQDYVPPDHPFVLRLDGRAFSKYTKQFKTIAEKQYGLPYSPEFKRAMLLTTHDLLHEFNACTVSRIKNWTFCYIHILFMHFLFFICICEHKSSQI